MKQLAPYLRKLLYVIGVAILISLLVFLNGKYKNQVLREIDIRVNAPEEQLLLTSDRILELIGIWYHGGLTGELLQNIDINDLEIRLKNEAAVEDAQVSTQLNGTISIEVDQKIPVVRFINEDGFSFYMDAKGNKIPVSGLRTARVPVAIGIQNDSLIKKVYTLSTYVYENEFMKAITEQIFVSEEGDLIIIPKFQYHQIIVGELTDLEVKFEKLKKYYKGGLKNLGWERYRSINLKFKDQVVCN